MLLTIKVGSSTHVNKTPEQLLGSSVAQSEIDEAVKQYQLDVVRQLRTPLLAEADILINKADDKGVDSKTLRQYRQALRDVTKQSDLVNINWPTKP